MNHTARPRTLLAWRIAAASLAFALSACGGDGADDPDGGSGSDGGPVDRRSPQDLDGDQWLNADDNCPMIANPEQRDRDRDGIGDACDTCPATPNGGQAGQPAQTDCAPSPEAEPNDTTPQAVTVRAVGQVSAVQGTIEAAGSAARPVDRFQLMLAAQSLVHVRVVRAGVRSLLEPELEVTGGSYVSSRRASGLFVAERDIYASAAGVYVIEVRDRRDEAGIGGELFGYELSITARDVVPDGLTAPVTRRTVRLDPPGTVGVFAIDLAAAQRTRVLVQSPIAPGHPTGIDPIVVVEGPDGAVLGESDDFLETGRDARYFGAFPGGRARVVVDHAEVIGTEDLELSLTIDQPSDEQELEPNDAEAFASPLVFPGQSRGQIDAPVGGVADVDVWSFTTATPGTVAGFRGLVDPASQVDPFLELGRYVDGRFEALYANADFSGPSARIEAILPQAGTWFLRVTDQRNVGRAPPRGGPLYPYTVFAETLGIQPQGQLTSSGTIEGTLDQGGRLLRYLVTASVGPSLLELRTIAVGVADELTPYLRVYRPGAVGVVTEGERTVTAFLPVAGTYVLAVHNAQDGAGALGYTFTIDARLTGLVEVPDGEPNDTTAQPVAGLPAGLVGRIDPATDVDRYAFALQAGDRLAVVGQPVVAALVLTLYAAGQSAPVAVGAAAISAYAATADGTYELAVSGGSVVDYQLAVQVR